MIPRQARVFLDQGFAIAVCSILMSFGLGVPEAVSQENPALDTKATVVEGQIAPRLQNLGDHSGDSFRHTNYNSLYLPREPLLADETEKDAAP